MIRLIGTEFKKLKGSKILFVCIIGNLIIPILSIMTKLKTYSNDSWTTYCMQSLSLNIVLIWPCLFGIINIFVFTRDYIEDTYKNLLIIAIGRTKLALAKVFTTFIIIFIISILSYLFNIAGIFIGIQFDSVEFFRDFKVYITAGFFMFISILPINLILINTKSYIISVSSIIFYEIISVISVWSKVLSSIVPITITLRLCDINALNIEYGLPIIYSYNIMFFTTIISITGILITANIQDH